MQIINNVAEEWVDLGQTDFATKAELCQTIQWLRQHEGDKWQRMHTAVSEIFTKAAQALMPNTEIRDGEDGAK